MKLLQILVILPAFFTLKVTAQVAVTLPLAKMPDSISVSLPFTLPTNTISSDYYKKQLGFFCLKELQVEKALKVPLKFRLGGMEYCNYLEGKNRQYR
jgi:hypothetical protein